MASRDRPPQRSGSSPLPSAGSWRNFQRRTAVATVPRQIVDAFYRVRFGGHSLDSGEAEAVERALSSLETALREAADRGRKEEDMKIGIVGYQGAGKSTLFEWLSGVPADPAKAHHGQTAMAAVPDVADRPIVRRSTTPRRSRSPRWSWSTRLA